MNDLIITIDRATRKVKKSRNFIGYSGENLQDDIVVDFTNKADFINGTAFFEVVQKGNPYFIEMEKDEENKSYKLPIKSSLLACACILKCGITIKQAETENGIPVFKSDTFDLICNDTINAIETIPEQYPMWVDNVDERLSTLEESSGGMTEEKVSEMINEAIGDIDAVLDDINGEVV